MVVKSLAGTVLQMFKHAHPTMEYLAEELQSENTAVAEVGLFIRAGGKNVWS